MQKKVHYSSSAKFDSWHTTLGDELLLEIAKPSFVSQKTILKRMAVQFYKTLQPKYSMVHGDIPLKSHFQSPSRDVSVL